MSRKLRRFLTGLLVVLILLGIVLGALAYSLPRRSFPTIAGEIKLEGLESPVDIYRDAYGVPHIYAATAHDLFFAQGYVHAQDRFYQMDFWRHIGSGRLAEMFGEAQLKTDIFLRRLGWSRIAEQELAAMDAGDQARLQAYADGVNAYLADHGGAALSLEYAVLKLLAPDYQPEPWTPVNSLTWAKAMAWNLGSGRLDSEVEHAVLSKTLTPEQIDFLFPAYPAENPLIVPGFQADGSASAEPARGLNPLFEGGSGSLLASAFQSLAGQLAGVRAVMGPSGGGIGSNSWVISGERSASGMPMLANDMHLGEQMPSIWYEAGLHCQPVGPDCPYEVTGYTFAGVPGVIVGHNQRVAWGFTNVAPDVLDLYIEKINPDNPNQYEVNGEWVDMQTVQDTLQVAGGEPLELTVRYTRHGPVIWDTAEEREETAGVWGIDLPSDFAISMRWTALEPAHTLLAFDGFNQAQNWDEMRQAARYFAGPGQNMVYADLDGNIGYQMLGNVPIRLPGHSGQFPVPGWTDEYEWQGLIPFEQQPFAFNPPEGYIVTANNAVVGNEYPYTITREWDLGYRARRIVELIEQAQGPISVEYFQRIQGDDLDQAAQALVPILLGLELNDAHLEARRAILEGWDYQAHMDQAGPALFGAFYRNLLSRGFHDELPEDYWPYGEDTWMYNIRLISQDLHNAWWDDVTTPGVENRDDIFRLALADAVAELEAAQGGDPQGWNWGDMHGTIFHNQSLGLSGVGPIEAIFNRGPFRTSGGSSIVNATNWDAATQDDLSAYQITWLPSMRMIVDFSDLAGALTINTTGQSGHAYHPHYIDQADLWRTIQYRPMLWERSAIQAGAEGHLVLKP